MLLFSLFLKLVLIVQLHQKIHQNVYFPDKGADAPHHIGLIDQWTSDKETITEESIEYAMNYFKPCYNEWKKKFGELPELWSKP